MDADTLLSTHLNELFKQHAADLLSRTQTERLLDRVKLTQTALVDDLIPSVLSITEVQRVLQQLLREQVPSLSIEQILETLLEYGSQTKDPLALTERVRQKLGGIICQRLMADAEQLEVLVLDPAIEQTFNTRLSNNQPLEIQFSEQLISRIAQSVESMIVKDRTPVLLCAAPLRYPLRKMTQRLLPHLHIISMAEIPETISIKSHARVTL